MISYSIQSGHQKQVKESSNKKNQTKQSITYFWLQH